jgi:hypothetical protein
MDGTPESTPDRRSHPAQRRSGVRWLKAVPDAAPDPHEPPPTSQPPPISWVRIPRLHAAPRVGCVGLPLVGPAAPVVGALFGTLTRARGARVFHPTGSGYHAEVVITPAGRPTGAPFLDEAGSYGAVVRFSRGAGAPDPLPDVLGLAIKVMDAHGPDLDQDLLLATSASPPGGRHFLLPATGFLGRQFSSVLPYLVGGRIRLFGAVAASPAMHDGGTALAEVHVAARTGGLLFDLTLAGEFGGWRNIGEVRVGAPLADEDAEALRFNPWHTGPGIKPIGLLQALRSSAYRGSQRRRR